MGIVDSMYQGQAPRKYQVRYSVSLVQEGQRVLVEVEEYDTSLNVFDWRTGEYLAVILKIFLAAGNGHEDHVEPAQSSLLPATDLQYFVVRWMPDASVEGRD